MEQFRGVRVTPDSCAALEDACRALLRDMFVGVEENPPISLRIETNNQGHVTLMPMNFTTFLAMNGIIVHSLRLAGTRQWTSDGYMFIESADGLYRIIPVDPISHVTTIFSL